MKILVGYDGSDVAKRALKLAREHAKAFGAEVIHVLHSKVTDLPTKQHKLDEQDMDEVRSSVREGRTPLRDAPAHTQHGARPAPGQVCRRARDRRNRYRGKDEVKGGEVAHGLHRPACNPRSHVSGGLGQIEASATFDPTLRGAACRHERSIQV